MIGVLEWELVMDGDGEDGRWRYQELQLRLWTRRRYMIDSVMGLRM